MFPRLSVLAPIELCVKWYGKHQCILSSRSRFTPCVSMEGGLSVMGDCPGGRTCFGDIWIFHRFTSSFVNPSFQYLNDSHIMYWNMMILNPSRFKVESHSKYWYFCIERWDLLSLPFSENAVLFYIEWVCRKTAGNVNRPPYRYTAVTHWARPPSSGTANVLTPGLVGFVQVVCKVVLTKFL